MRVGGAVAIAMLGTLAAVTAPRGASAAQGDLEAFGGWHVASARSDLGGPERAGQVVSDGPVAGVRLGLFVWDELSLEGEAFAMSTHAAGDAADTATVVGWRAQAVLWWTLPKGALGLEVGAGSMTVSASQHAFEPGGGIDRGTVATAHAGASARLALGRVWGLRLEARALFVPANNLDDGASLTVDWEVGAGLYVRFGGAKPGARVRAHAPVAVSPRGPPAQRDSDGDGVVDDRDACPDRAEDKDGFEDDDGCPDDDNDRDGVPDAQDKCPVAAEDRDGYMDDDGCPEDDNDRDGLLDAQDKCPNEAEDKDGFEDDDGCPEDDNDRDGVKDADDRCPLQAETRNGWQDDDGCPDELPRPLRKYVGVVAGVAFVGGAGAKLGKASMRVLDGAAKVLQEYREVRVEIGVHGDDEATTQARADAVRAYLVRKGVAEDRLVAVGYGEGKPLEVGTSKKARARNRRVEFTLLTK